jgi:hypothetical protein
LLLLCLYCHSPAFPSLPVHSNAHLLLSPAFTPSLTAKKDKDPNAPKKPNTSYIIFTKEKRQSVMDANPGIKFTEVTKEIAKIWNALDEKGQAKYVELAKKDKVRYETEKAAYDAKNSK